MRKAESVPMDEKPLERMYREGKVDPAMLGKEAAEAAKRRGEKGIPVVFEAEGSEEVEKRRAFEEASRNQVLELLDAYAGSRHLNAIRHDPALYRQFALKLYDVGMVLNDRGVKGRELKAALLSKVAEMAEDFFKKHKDEIEGDLGRPREKN